MGNSKLLDDALAFSSKVKEYATNYLELYEEVKELETVLKQRKEVLELAKEELYGEMDLVGSKTVELDKADITKSVRTFPKVSDHAKLLDYITKVLQVPISEYTRLKFISSKLSDIVKDAQKTALKTNQKVVLPEGLVIATTKILTVREKGDNL